MSKVYASTCGEVDTCNPTLMTVRLLTKLPAVGQW
jgi:hypothetical protein